MNSEATSDGATVHDIAIVGGGINGCGIARDAAGRGLSVVLMEQGDLASATSSASSKLIHGGIRYLEHYEFRLVRESLRERDVVLRIAPHISRPMRFVFPHNPSMRPMWMIRLGLFLYDHLGGVSFESSRAIPGFPESEAGEPLKSGFAKAFEYSDCWIDDARLVVLNARDAHQHGARIMTRTRCTSAASEEGCWRLEATDAASGETQEIRSRVLINAAGPWASDFLDDHVEAGFAAPRTDTTRKVKGSHLVVKKWYPHDRAYILQNDDGRIVFVLPFEDEYVLVGTTDVDFDGDPADARMSSAEKDYLVTCINGYFRQQVTEEDVVGSFAGVRPLYDDGAGKAQEATRDYVLKTARTVDGAGMVNIYGGKLTTYRKLAESVLDRVSREFLPMGEPWTEGAPLPGGDFDHEHREKILNGYRERYAFLPAQLVDRYFRAYGTELEAMLDGVDSASAMGWDFGGGLYAREVGWMMSREWACSVDDVLWRRSKLALNAGAIDIPALRDWIKQHGEVAADGDVRGDSSPHDG